MTEASGMKKRAAIGASGQDVSKQVVLSIHHEIKGGIHARTPTTLATPPAPHPRNLVSIRRVRAAPYFILTMLQQRPIRRANEFTAALSHPNDGVLIVVHTAAQGPYFKPDNIIIGKVILLRSTCIVRHTTIIRTQTPKSQI